VERARLEREAKVRARQDEKARLEREVEARARQDEKARQEEQAQKVERARLEREAKVLARQDEKAQEDSYRRCLGQSLCVLCILVLSILVMCTYTILYIGFRTAIVFFLFTVLL